MSTGATATLEPETLPGIERSEMARLEALGDNCEFGFLLRRLGFEDGMLFRWASIRPQCLLAALRNDFKDLYEFDNLVSAQVGMVRDLHYGIAWHTQMYSSPVEGTLTFNDSVENRRGIHARESAKLAYLLEKLRCKFDHPNPVFVIKANIGIPEQILEDIHYQIYRRVSSPRFLLLEVRDDPSRAGTVEMLDRHSMRGYVAHLAPYERSEEADDAGWISVLSQALAHNAEIPVVSPTALSVPAPRVVVLPFPVGSGPDLLAPAPGDLRGGMPSLIGGGAWCRIVNEDTYRLHAIGLKGEATVLRWTGVYLPLACTLTISAWCAIAESLPIRATLEIVAGDGMTLRGQQVFDRIVEQNFSLSTPVNLPNPLVVSLYVEPLAPLRPGERAVIDVDQIKAVPTNGALAD